MLYTPVAAHIVTSVLCYGIHVPLQWGVYSAAAHQIGSHHAHYIAKGDVLVHYINT